MLLYTDPMRIYLFKDRNLVKLSILVTSSMVESYLIEHEQFCHLLDYRFDRYGATIHSRGVEYFIQHKKVGTNQEYHRLSVSPGDGAIRDHRLSPDSFDSIARDYADQLNNPMPWDK
jgi:hypothetical protein